jgi:SnoaL-like polyketide cyclase
VTAGRFAEVRADAGNPFRGQEESNKVIVDRWLTRFWGKSYDPSIVDALTDRNVFFNHSLFTPQVGPVSLKTFMADLREAFPDFSVEKNG